MAGRRTLRPCLEPGCPELTARASGRCDHHEQQARAAEDATRGNFRQRGYDREYDANHARVLHEETHCWICKQLVDKSLTGPNGPSVDHVIRRADGGSNARDNLRLAHLHCNSGRRDHGAATTPATGTHVYRTASTSLR